MEILDIAAERTLAATETLIALASKKAPLELTGRCRYCGEEQEGKNFCNIECRDDYEFEQRQLNSKGY